MDERRFEVDEDNAGLRLDVFLAEMVEDASRSFMQKLVKGGQVSVNGHAVIKPSRTLNVGEAVKVALPEPPPLLPEPESIPLEILYEDEHLLLVNKPSGMVVHPAPGHATGTLVNAVLHHCGGQMEQSGLDPVRPGIVHRLDRETSGVMVVAKTRKAFASLAEQASEHRFDRRYQALARGEFPEERGRITAPIGRSLSDHGRMTVTGVRSKEAVTNFEVLERYGVACRVALQLETGRTHQIRVHMRFAGRPVLGDPTYGVTDFRKWPVADHVRAALEALRGQALHAERLGIEHPVSGEMIVRTAPPPADFLRAVDALRSVAAGA